MHPPPASAVVAALLAACADPSPEPTGPKELWVSGYADGAVVRLGPDREPVGRFDDLPGAQAIWVASDQRPGMDRFDRATGVLSESVDPGLAGVTFAAVIP